jgi:two-component system, OmpR family, sensor histidine kinase KdpD
VSQPGDAPGGGGLDAAALSDLAHHLKNPLAAILGYAELLRDRDDESTRREAPARIHAAATVLSYAVDDLVTALSLDAGAVELDPEPIELDLAVDRAIDEVAGMPGGGAGTTFRRRKDMPWPIVTADAHLLQRIVVNVLRSTADAAAEARCLELEGGSNGVAGVLSMTAAGRLDTDRQAWGTGLGLSNARRLAELHGGSFGLSRAAGRTTLRLVLPLAAPTAS